MPIGEQMEDSDVIPGQDIAPVSTPKSVAGWLPIETAPRDGTWVLLLNNEQFCQTVTDDADDYAAQIGIGRWDTEAAKYHPHHPAWRSLHEHTEWFSGSELTGSWDVTETEVLAPTHWMPLPTPPGEAASPEGGQVQTLEET